jgi:uncharacterized RDD family membrane protein YckC
LAKLVVNPTSPQRQEVVLPRTLLSIGRDPSNDLVLPDAMVSRRHAVIELRGSQFFLRDCNSSNGSLVNGDRISERGLRDGDLVAIGTARLLFREDVEALDPAGKVVQHPSAPRLRCPQCGTDFRRGDLFCKQCGTAVQSVQPKAVCTACGTAVPLPARFCNACGARLASELGQAFEPTSKRPIGAGEGEAAPAGGAASPNEPEPAGALPVAAEMGAPAAVSKASASAGGASPPLEIPAAALEPLVAQPPARVPGEKTVPPVPPRPRPVSLVAGAAAPSLPPPRALREVPPRDARPPEKEAPASPRGDDAADLGSRLLGGALDAVVVSAGQALLLAPAAYYWWSRDLSVEVAFAPIALSVALLALSVSLGALYFIYFWGVRGATPGKRLVGVAVAASDGSSPIGLPRAAARLLGYLLSAALLGGGFLLIALDGYGLHDRIAGTRVVRRRK